ncbi:Protein of unknown function DUF761 [Macleaya cordata]|uniref:DUF4408 domain-containing protein n=1 Tax=Macleaya cordata TaxID=56857 RepID=A0A200QH75_MACCD|nr:Protein of unknown function DUF761 [Macleaya cordata]
MDKQSQLKYSSIAKLCIIVLLLLITPLLSTSMRPPYLYFLLNLLIIAVGAEAGLLSSLFKPPEDKKQQPVLVVPTPTKPYTITTPSTTTTTTTNTSLVETSHPNKETDAVVITNNQMLPAELGHEGNNERKVKKKVEKCVSEKIVRVVKVRTVKKCPSTPSLFFIGGGEADHHHQIVEDHHQNHQVVNEDMEEEEEEFEAALSGQELFTKAETFICNFYKQLKIQREDSWKRLHDFYHKKAF